MLLSLVYGVVEVRYYEAQGTLLHILDVHYGACAALGSVQHSTSTHSAFA